MRKTTSFDTSTSLITLLAVAVVSLLGMTACDEPRDDFDPDDEKVENVAEEPSTYIGETITATGEIEEAYSARAFLLEGDEVMGDVLVVVPDAVDVEGSVEEETNVTVKGLVDEFVPVELKESHGLDVDLESLDYAVDQPVIISESVVVFSGDAI